MSFTSLRQAVPGIGVLLIAACGGDSATSPGGGPANPSPSVAEALTVDLSALPNYAAPAWPIHYDAIVLSRDNEPAGNPVTDAGALLGRVLFYDRRLSINNRVSCASCHRQSLGFVDADRFSLGFNRVDRTAFHSMRLLNARFFSAGNAFWDRRAPTLEAQVTEPIQNPIEMGFDAAHGGLDSLVHRMQGLLYYRELFAFVYGDSTVTEDRISRSVAQFVRSLVSLDSRFDRAFAEVYDQTVADRGITRPFPAFTAQENRGKQLFLVAPASGGAGCSPCHLPPTFALNPVARSNGVDPNDTTLYKSPSLKSLAVTGPYMHNGSLKTLEQVVEFYDHQINDVQTLDPLFRTPTGVRKLNLSSSDKAALVAFMKTLSDNSISADPRFSDPFRQ